MPVLFALFSALRDFTYTGEGASFLWLKTLTEPDPTIIMPVIVGLSSFLQSKLTMAAQPPANDQAKMMNNVMLYGMPVMLAFMTRNFVAGLGIYWSVFNVSGFLLQMLTNTIVNRSQEGLKAALEAEEKKEEKKEKSDEAETARRRQQNDTAKKKAAEKKRVKYKRSGINQSQNDKGKALDFDDYQ